MRDAVSTSPAPILSVVVVVHDMPEQARRTLKSLSPECQRGVAPADYEVIVVENASQRLLGAESASASGPNVRYLLREADAGSPGAAVNEGARLARGDALALCIDGARLVTPGVVALALFCRRMTESAVLAVPGYHLGDRLQQEAVASGYDAAHEAALLASIRWPEDGYRLFDVACFSGSCRAGFFLPFSESNFLVVPRALFESIGGYDTGFASPGGGYTNLDVFTRVVEAPGTTLFVSPGEGTFHQFHGGVTTGGVQGGERDRLMDTLAAEYDRLRGRPYAVPRMHPMYIGAVPAPARRFVRESVESAEAAR